MKVSFVRLRDILLLNLHCRVDMLIKFLVTLLSAVIMWHRKIPVVSLGFVQFHKGFWAVL